MCWAHMNALPARPELTLNWETVTWVRHTHSGAPCHCAQSEGTQIKLQQRHTSYMNEHTYVASRVQCGVWGQQVCGMPEATYVLNFMGSITMDHLMLSLIHFWGYISGSRKQLLLAVILIQPGIYAIKVTKLLCNHIIQNRYFVMLLWMLHLMSGRVTA